MTAHRQGETMSDAWRILFVEDSEADFELEERELRAGGLTFAAQRVETEAQFTRAIAEFQPHVILCDYSLPSADGPTFLSLAKEQCPDVPFMFVSGAIGEERAIDALKNGAVDYVLKHRLGALAVRVRRALEEAAQRQHHQQLEAQLRQAQKVEAIGQLAGGVAHDFNNLLTVITGYTDLSLGRLPDGHPVRANLEEVLRAAERAAELTRQLLAFARRQILAPRVLDLNTVVSGTTAMLERLIGEDVELVVRLDPNVGRIKADPTQIEQVIMNLAVNARDAMPEGGRLILETDNVDLDEAYARDHQGVRPGPYVRLAVGDTGQGMDQATLDHLFEPFFTTKGPGKGTGMGLATVYGVVKQSNGNIWVYSEVGRGTTFKIYLPRVEDPVDETAPSRPSTTSRGSETILLVEDNQAVRQLARRALEEHGYHVLEAEDGARALALVEAHGGPLHLVVTDVVMPGMHGQAVAEAVRARRPDVKVLYLSGYTATAIVHHGVLDPDTPFMEKPYTPAALAAKVREVLDS